MVRNVLGLITGLVVAGLATFFVQSINYSLFPLPLDLDTTDMEAMKEYLKSLPIGASIIVIVAHFVGALFGALVCSIIADHSQIKLSLFIGSFMMLMGLINLFSFPHPIWFGVVDTLIYLPGAFCGYLIFKHYWKS